MNKLHNFYFLSVLFYWVVCRANVWLLTLILCTTWSSRVHWPPSCHGNSIVGRTDVCDVTIRMTSDLENHIWDFFSFLFRFIKMRLWATSAASKWRLWSVILQHQEPKRSHTVSIRDCVYISVVTSHKTGVYHTQINVALSEKHSCRYYF